MSQRERNVRLEVVLITNTCFFQLLNAQHSLPSEISGCFSNVVARLERRWLLRLLCVGRKSVGCVGWQGGTPRPGLPGTPGLPGLDVHGGVPSLRWDALFRGGQQPGRRLSRDLGRGAKPASDAWWGRRRDVVLVPPWLCRSS